MGSGVTGRGALCSGDPPGRPGETLRLQALHPRPRSNPYQQYVQNVCYVCVYVRVSVFVNVFLVKCLNMFTAKRLGRLCW